MIASKKISFKDPHVELVERCKQGDRKAQFEIYRLYSKAMLNVSMRILNHIGESEDALQEAFVLAFSKIREFEGVSSFGAWLKKIVVHISLDILRKKKWILEDIDQAEEIYHIEDREYEEDELHLEVKKVRDCIQLLPDGYRVVLSLYLLEGYDHEEIAHILKISEGTSRSQYLRAKNKLVAIIKERSI